MYLTEWKQYKFEKQQLYVNQGKARTQFPTNRNYAPELPAFGVIAKVSPTEVQWKGLTLGEPPSGSRYPLCQVSMLCSLQSCNTNSSCIFKKRLLCKLCSNICWQFIMINGNWFFQNITYFQCTMKFLKCCSLGRF